MLNFKTYLSDSASVSKILTEAAGKNIFKSLSAIFNRHEKDMPSCSSLKDFARYALMGYPHIQYKGYKYILKMSVHPKEIHLDYNADEDGPRDTYPENEYCITVHLALSGKSGHLEPYKVVIADSDQPPLVLNPNLFVQHSLGAKSTSKEDIISAILKAYKSEIDDVETDTYLTSKDMIKLARKHGHNYPEFDAIHKSIDAKRKADILAHISHRQYPGERTHIVIDRISAIVNYINEGPLYPEFYEIGAKIVVSKSKRSFLQLMNSILGSRDFIKTKRAKMILFLIECARKANLKYPELEDYEKKANKWLAMSLDA